jgi:hypothetical protein
MNTSLLLKARFTRRLLTIVITVVAAISSAGRAEAAACGDSPLDISLGYSVSTSIGQPIENIISWNNYECNAGGSGTYTIAAGGETFPDLFLKSSSNKPINGLMIGTTHDLEGDAEGQEHLVFITNTAWASAAANIAFGTLFPSTLEENLIAALHVWATTSDQDAFTAASNTISSFVFGELSTAFFTLGAVIPGTTTTTDFSVIAFSDGKVIGGGIASLTTALPDNPAPVPAPVLLVLAGLTALGLRRAQSQ